MADEGLAASLAATAQSGLPWDMPPPAPIPRGTRRVYIAPPAPPAPPISGPEAPLPQPEPAAAPSSITDKYPFLPRLEDFKQSLADSNAAAAEMTRSGGEAMRSGDLLKTALGAAQATVAPLMPLIAPVGAAWDSISKAAGRTGPGLAHAVDVISQFNPESILGVAGKAGPAIAAIPPVARRPKTLAEIKAAADRAEGKPVTAPTTGEQLAETAAAPIGHNMPPETTPPAPPPAPTDIAVAPPNAPKVSKSTDLLDIRDVPRDYAIAIARQEPHLIKGGEGSAGYYVGGPRNLASRRGLTNLRKNFDAYVGQDPRGGDWYDRYRNYVTEVTGGNPLDVDWMRKQHGQWSAGVDPASEQHFVLKENNAALAGMPTRANYPAQHEAFMRAVAAKDPNLLQLGDKTGEYADLISPIRPDFVGATGVNDFRHARNWGYTETSGAPQKGALGDAGHRFLDYETALAVDRANKANLGGRSDWTGEQLQAAPWVRQKALDLMSRNKNLTYAEAFERANKTIADFGDKHTAFATYEAQPGAAGAGHMPGSVNATIGERLAYAEDPRSSWSNAPGGRDAIYSEMRLPGTGVAMRVRPTQAMQGMYQGPAGLETNPGFAARPQVTFDTSTGAFKSITPADRALLNAGEATRAYIDAQNAGAWHKLWFGGPAGESTSLHFPKGGKSTVGELLGAQAATSPHGLPDVVDTGQGITATRFWPPLEDVKKGEKDQLGSVMRKGVFGDAVPGSEPRRARVDSDIVDYSDRWTEGAGSGAATRKLLEHVSKTPEIRAALNNNPLIAQNAMDRLLRDEQWAAKWGAPRQDIQNARRIIANASNSKDWIDRLEAALKMGTVTLPAVAAIVGSAAQLSGVKEGRPANEGS